MSCLNFQFMMHNCQMRNININKLSVEKSNQTRLKPICRTQASPTSTSAFMSAIFHSREKFVKSLFASVLDWIYIVFICCLSFLMFTDHPKIDFMCIQQITNFVPSDTYTNKLPFCEININILNLTNCHLQSITFDCSILP